MSKASAGIWSPLENSQFEEGVIKYGWGKWLEISKCIPSRRKCQVKSHAQKFAIHRADQYAELLRKHAAAMKEGICGRKPKPAATKPVAKKKRLSRSSMQRTATSAVPAPVKVRRASKSSIETPTSVVVRRSSKSSIESAATVSPKLTLAKGKAPSDEHVKKPKLGSSQTLAVKSDTSKEPKLRADQSSPSNASGLGAQLMELEISTTKVDFAGPELSAPLMQFKSTNIKLENSITKSYAADKFEMRFEPASAFSTVVTPAPSFKSNAEEAEELKGLIASLDYLDVLENDHKVVEDDSFALTLEDDIFDINLEEEDIIPDVIDIVEDDSVAPDEQQIRSRALMHLRLQVQPNECALDEITALLESPSDLRTSESKGALMRQRIIRLATEALDEGWWRESEKMKPEVVQKAHLEHLVSVTFAVLQADAWRHFSGEINPSETCFNAQDDIRYICQLIPGIWHRVNFALARDSYTLFGAGTDQLERSNAVNKMVRMFEDIPNQSE